MAVQAAVPVDEEAGEEVKDPIEIAQEAAPVLAEFGNPLEAAAVVAEFGNQLEAVLVDEEAAGDSMSIARNLAHILAGIGARAAMVLSDALAARAVLAEAANLLREDIDATQILVADALAVIPTRDDPAADREATLAAAAKLVSSVFSEAPVLPEPVSAAMDLVLNGYDYEIPSQITGKSLQNLLSHLSKLPEDLENVDFIFTECVPDLGIQPGDETWLAWSARRSQDVQEAMKAVTRVSSAIWGVQQANCIRCLYQDESRRHGERMREAWKIDEIVRAAIQDMDAALVAILWIRDAVATEGQIVRDVIDAAAAP